MYSVEIMRTRMVWDGEFESWMLTQVLVDIKECAEWYRKGERMREMRRERSVYEIEIKVVRYLALEVTIDDIMLLSRST